MKMTTDLLQRIQTMPLRHYEREQIVQAYVAAEAIIDVMFSIGTSTQVYPAAGLPFLAKDHGAFVIEINPDSTELTPYAHAHLRGPSGTILPDIVTALTAA
jgi:NAD-dependent deacetylase